MDNLSPLLLLRRCILWNVLRTVGQHSRLKLASIVVLGGGIWIGLYVFSYYGFHWIVRLLRQDTMSDMLVSVLFLILSVMLVFSNAVIAYAALFRSKESWFLWSCPLRPSTLFLYKLGESLAFSSWAFLLLGAPIMLAYGVHKMAPWYYYIAMFAFFFSFILIPASVGALIALALSALLRPWMRRALTRGAVLVAAAALIIGPYCAHRARPEANIFRTATLVRQINLAHSVYWPSSWISRGLAICAGSRGSETWEDALYYLGLLIGNSLFLCLLASAFAGRAYAGAWDRIHSASSRRRTGRRIGLAGRGPAWPMFHLLVKDLKTFIRDPVQWTQCAVLFGLLGLYILNLRTLRYPSEMPRWRNLTTFLNLGSICLVLATLTTRFVFPMFSLEGARFWVLGLAPIKRSNVLWSKLLFAFLTSLAITEVLMITSDLILGEPWGLVLLHVFTVAMISLGLSGMAVGLSVLYPNLRETNPAKIVSGFGGTLNLILSLLYVAIVVPIEAAPVHLWRTGLISYPQMLWDVSLAVGVLVVLTGVAFGLPMWLGARALARMEF